MLDSKRTRWVFAVALWWPTLGLALKYTAVAGAAAYSIIVLTSPWWLPPIAAALQGRVGPAAFRAATVACVLGLVLLFTAVYPHANSQVPGHGSDADDALNVAAHALLRGGYLYRERTYLGNPIAPLPGAVLFALPFVILGTSALQSLLWLPILGWSVYRAIQDRGLALLVWLAVPLLSVAVIHAVVTGSDELVNGTYVALLSVAAVRILPDAEQPRFIRVLCGVGWGLSLASRASFLPMFPIVIYAVATRRDWATALRYGAVTATAAAAVTLPFFVYEPGSFGPLHTADKLTLSGTVTPALGLGIYVAALAAGLSLMGHRGETFLLPSIIALGVPLVLLTLIFTAIRGEFVLERYCGYGLMVLPFAVLLVASEAGDLTLPEGPDEVPVGDSSVAGSRSNIDPHSTAEGDR